MPRRPRAEVSDAHHQAKELATLGVGDILKIVATDKTSVLDFQGWAKQNAGFELVGRREKDDTGRDVYVHLLAKRA